MYAYTKMTTDKCGLLVKFKRFYKNEKITLASFFYLSILHMQRPILVEITAASKISKWRRQRIEQQ